MIDSAAELDKKITVEHKAADVTIAEPGAMAEQASAPLAEGEAIAGQDSAIDYVASNHQSVMQRLSEKDQWRRTYLHAITNVALLQELLFLFFQYQATYNGLLELGVEQTIAKTVAAPLSIADWLVNVLSVSVPADADNILFPIAKNFHGFWAVMEPTINLISMLGSYSIGAAADALPLLALISQGSERWKIGLINYGLIAANILPGANYYRLFNHAKIAKHIEAFKAFCTYPSLFFKRLRHSPINLLRYFEVLRSWLAVVGYRSVNFAFIAQALGPYLLNPTSLSDHQKDYFSDVIAIVALLATATNVSFSRLLPSYEHLAQLPFDGIESSEYTVAAYQIRQQALATWIGTLRTLGSGFLGLLPNAVSALGWGILCHSFLEQPEQAYWVGALVGSVFLLNSCYVDYQAAVYKKAVQTLVRLQTPHAIDFRLQQIYGELPQATEAVRQEEANFQSALQSVQASFQQLQATFSLGFWAKAGLVTANVGSRVARSIGFYGFVKTLADTFSYYAGVEINDKQILALCLMLAPENFKNEWLVFDESMKEVIQGWQAKCYIERLIQGGPLSYWRTFSVCLRKSPYDFSLVEVHTAWDQRQRDLMSSTPPSRERSSGSLESSSDLSTPFLVPSASSSDHLSSLGRLCRSVSGWIRPYAMPAHAT